jgi:uncharacterized protein
MRVDLNSSYYSVLNKTSGRSLGNFIRVAQTPQDKAIGLLRQSSLPAGEGLLIPDCSSIHMVGMQFPIDVVWVDALCYVQGTNEHLPPGATLRMNSPLALIACLELPAGTIAASQTQVGHFLQFDRVA